MPEHDHPTPAPLNPDDLDLSALEPSIAILPWMAAFPWKLHIEATLVDPLTAELFVYAPPTESPTALTPSLTAHPHDYEPAFRIFTRFAVDASGPHLHQIASRIEFSDNVYPQGPPPLEPQDEMLRFLVVAHVVDYQGRLADPNAPLRRVISDIEALKNMSTESRARMNALQRGIAPLTR